MENGLQNEMRVTKRNGDLETIEFDKILKRIKSTGQEANIVINYTALVMKVIDQLYDTISTTKIDELTAEQCASMSSIHPDYDVLAGRIVVSNHQKNTIASFSQVVKQLYHYLDKHDKLSPLVSDELYEVTMANSEVLDSYCDFSRDYLIDYFGFKTLERAYLMKINDKTAERPQHMWLRVALGIHGDNLEKVKETYDYMSQKYFTHATPTLFNAGTPHPQLSSCFLISMESDSINGIYNTLKDCANISKWAGGIGLHIHNVRASGSHIRGTNGKSNGIVPMLRVFNNTAKYVDQCVHPETIIYTENQGLIQIKDCVAGITRIYGKNGDSEVIQNILEHNYQGEIVEITTSSSISPLLITPQHPIYVVSGVLNETTHQVINDLSLNLRRAEFKDVKDINIGDYIVYSIPKTTVDFPELTEEHCYMYGFLLNSISVLSDTCFYLNVSNEDAKQIIRYCDKYFIQWELLPSDNKTPEQCTIKWYKSTRSIFHTSDFVSNKSSLHISTRWLYLPNHKLECILKGFENNHSEITQEHRSAIYWIQIRLRLVGIQHENYCLVPITNIQTSDYQGLLYDLQMKTEHNYLLESGLVHNGGGRRHGSFAIYLEPWHADIELFLQMRKNHGDEELKARDLFYALWIPDLFMERVKTNGTWTLMCPDECPGLSDVYGDDFEKLYTRYETEGKGRVTLKARDLWFQVLDAQMETGTPYILFKDAANKKSNQKNIGTIKSSNLCCEILEYSDENETAVCNLGSIALPTFLDYSTTPPTFDYEKLHKVTKVITENLNRIIDRNYYPTEKTRRSNMRHRPIGIGIQGLADVFILMGLAFTSEDAKLVNRNVFETMYHAALERSCELARTEGYYETFVGSPASQGVLQFDMWSYEPGNSRYDWPAMKAMIQEHGLRNSLLLAPMPTASTSQILGFNECFEPITSNIYSRRTIAGEFVMTNKYLMRDLLELGMWNDQIKNSIISNNGSIQQIDIIPETIREKYKTAWEIPMKTVIDMAADRGVFICQSQSMNTWIEEPSYNSLTSMHFYSWQKGLKTGIYYLRRRAAHQAQQFTIEPEKRDRGGSEADEEHEICEMCSG